MLDCDCISAEFFTNVTSPTVWYSLLGTGEITQISVFADFDVQVSIYSGECDSLTCVFTNDDSPIPGPSSIIAEYLNEGQQVHIQFRRCYCVDQCCWTH